MYGLHSLVTGVFGSTSCTNIRNINDCLEIWRRFVGEARGDDARLIHTSVTASPPWWASFKTSQA